MRASTAFYLVQDVIQETPQVRSFRFHYGLSRFDFQPGQFVIVDHPSVKDLQAPITLSTAPTDSCFELTVKRIGNFGTLFYDSVDVGQMISFAPPQGRPLQQTAAGKPLCFIARDYCVTAARSLLRSILAQTPEQQFVLIHELSEPSEQLYAAEFSAADGMAGFRYLPLATSNCGGFSLDLLAEVLPGWEGYNFQLCGEAEEVLRFKSELKAAGVPSAQVAIERWS